MSQIHGAGQQQPVQQANASSEAAPAALENMGCERSIGNPVSRFFRMIGSFFSSIADRIASLFRSASTEQAQPRLAANMPEQDPVRAHNTEMKEQVRYNAAVRDEVLAAGDQAVAELSARFGLENVPVDQDDFMNSLDLAISRSRTALARENLPEIAKSVVSKMIVANFVGNTIDAALSGSPQVSRGERTSLTVFFKGYSPEVKALAEAPADAPNLAELGAAARAAIQKSVREAVVATDVAHALCVEGFRLLREKAGVPAGQAEAIDDGRLSEQFTSDARSLLSEGKATEETLYATLLPKVQQEISQRGALYSSIAELRDTAGLDPEVARSWQEASLDTSLSLTENFYTVVHSAATALREHGVLNILLDPHASVEQCEAALQTAEKIQQGVTGPALGNNLSPDMAARLILSVYTDVVTANGGAFGNAIAAQPQRNQELLEAIDKNYTAAEAAERLGGDDATAARRVAGSNHEIFTCLTMVAAQKMGA